jgi:hypothetical protein
MNEKELKECLGKCGQAAFVYCFEKTKEKKGQILSREIIECYQPYSEKKKLSQDQSRRKNAIRKIFRAKKEIKALEICSQSEKIEAGAIKKAKALLQNNQGSARKSIWSWFRKS